MKKIALFALLTVFTAGAVFAQAIGTWTSPQSTSTQGRFRSDADNFIRPDSFNTVKFEKWFGMMSFADTGRAMVGYASKIGGNEEGADSTFLGIFYNGSLWANAPALTYNTGYGTFKGSNSSDVKTYTTLPGLGTTRPYNHIAALIGLADMGFRLSILSTFEIFKDEDFISGGAQYKSYETGAGAITPQIAWSLTQNVTDKGVKPWATLDIGFVKDYTKSQVYAQEGANWVDGNETVTNSQNYTNILLNLGLGGITIAEKDGWKTSFDFEYRLGLPLYSNEYSSQSSAAATYSISKIKGRNTNGALDEYTASNHRLRPILLTQWSGEKLALKARIDFNVNIEASESTPKAMYDYSLTTVGNTVKRTFLGFTPDIQLGMQWKLHPKLSLNAGGRIYFNAMSRTKTTGDLYGANGDKVDNSSYETITTAYGAATNTFAIGATFDSGDNVFFEATTGATGENISVFGSGTGGLFQFYNLLVGFRF